MTTRWGEHLICSSRLVLKTETIARRAVIEFDVLDATGVVILKSGKGITRFRPTCGSAQN